MATYKFDMQLHPSQADTSEGRLSRMAYTLQTGHSTLRYAEADERLENRMNAVERIGSLCVDNPRMSLMALNVLGEQSLFEKDQKVMNAIQHSALEITATALQYETSEKDRAFLVEVMKDIFRPQVKPPILKNEKVVFGGNREPSYVGC